MAYENFEKDGVQYTLFSGMHTRSNYPLIRNAGGLEALDVLILENNTGDIGYLETIANGTKNDIVYSEIFRQVPEENPNIKIYDIDFFNSGLVCFTSLLPLATSLFSAPLMLTAFSKKRKNEGIGQRNTRREFLKRSGKFLAGFLGFSYFGGTIGNGVIETEDLEPLSQLPRRYQSHDAADRRS